ncbi:MAG: hypothetical protein AB7O80_08585 [Acetobacteraceae bacterium]
MIGLTLLVPVTGGSLWWLSSPEPTSPEPAQVPLPLPLPPYPPRIAEGPEYDHCLDLLPEDPAAAITMADAWRARGGGEPADHCTALAVIANGHLAEGAAMLERLAHKSTAPKLARAMLLSQAADVRLQSDQPAQALQDAADALALSPDNASLLIQHAAAAAALDRQQDAVSDLTRVLSLAPDQTSALVARASALRKLDRMAQAEADVEQALRQAPEDPEALLERGILRQWRGDTVGARTDWERVRSLDPDSQAADLAEQNLALLAVGPKRR